MNHFLLRSNWEHLYGEVWTPLSQASGVPADLFIELFRYASNKLGLDPDEGALKDPKISRERNDEISEAISKRWQILNDSQLAEEEFERLPVPASEQACIKLLEGFYSDVFLKEFGSTDIPKNYCSTLRGFFESRNLRYTLSSTCKIQLSLTGLILSHYAILKKSALVLASMTPPDTRRRDFIEELENKVGHLMDQNVERDCIRVVSNILEEVVVRKSKNGKKTLGKAWKGCPKDIFPHRSFNSDIEGFWTFVCNYPGLRHPGDPNDKIRDLVKDDAILSVWLGVILATYIMNNDSYGLILAGQVE